MQCTPDEIAQMLTKIDKRPLWELGLKHISQLQTGTVITTSRSGDKSQLDYDLFIMDENTSKSFLISESISMNENTHSKRLYEIEEIQNRPHFVRLTLYAPMLSEAAGRSVVAQLNSLHNQLVQESRE